MTALYQGDDPMLTLGRRIRRLQTAFPEIANAPSQLMALAQSPGDDDAMLDQAATVVTVNGFKTRMDGLKQLSEGDQRKEWKAYDARAQAALRRLGYKPPKPKSWGSINLPNLPNLPKIGGIDLPDLPNLPTIGPTKGSNLVSNVPAVVTAPLQVGTQLLRKAGGATMDAMQAGTDVMARGYRAASAQGSELQFGRDGVRVGQAGTTADAEALKLDVANAALDRAIADGTLTQARGARLRANSKSLLDWFDDIDDDDVPKGWDTYRAYSGSWADAWRGAENGARQFTPKAELDARDMLGDDEGVILLAKRTAAGETVAEILADDDLVPSSPEYYAKASELYETMKTPRFDEAVKRLAGDKLTPGGDVRRSVGLSSTSTMGKVVESATDIGFMFVADPTLVGGKGFTAVRTARSALRGVDVGEELATIGRVLDGTHVARTGPLGALAEVELQGRVASHRRALTKIAAAYTEGTPAAMERLVREMPQVTRGLTYLTEYHNTVAPLADEMAVFRAVSDGAGLATLASGRMGRVAVTGGIEVPRLTRAQQAAAQTSRVWKDTVDRMTDLPTGVLPNLARGKVVTAGKAAVGNVGRVVASGGLQPIRPYLNLEDTVEVRKAIRGLSMLGVKSDDRAKLFTDFVMSVNETGRSEVVAAISKEMLTRTGVFEVVNNATNPKAVKAAQDVIDRVARMKHAVGGIDEHVGTDGVVRNAGVVGGVDFSHMRQLPTFTELLRAGDRAAFMQRTYNWTNPATMEAFMSNVWKPAVLLRASFIPRAAGEEMLTYVLRHGGADLAKTFGSKSVAKSYLAGYAKGQTQALPKLIEDAVAAGASAEDIAVLTEKAAKAAKELERFRYSTGTHTILGLTDKLASKVPPTRVLSRAAHLVAGLATDVVRAGAGTLANPEYVAAAKSLLAHEDYAWAAYTDLVAGTRAAIAPLNESVQVQRDGSMVVVGMNRERSAFEEVPLRGDTAQTANWVKRLDRVKENPLWRAFAEPAARAIGDVSETKLLDAARLPTGTRFAGKDGAEVVRNIRTQISELATRDSDMAAALERWATSGTAPTDVAADFAAASKQASATGTYADRIAADAAARPVRAEAATWTDVGRENLNFYLQPEVAQRSIENKLFARAIENDPSLNNAWIVDADGNMKIDVSALPDDLVRAVRAEASEYSAVFTDLAHTLRHNLNARERALVYSKANVQSGQRAKLRGDLEKSVTKALGTEEAAEWLTEGDRLAGVAVPPKTGQMGMYRPSFTPEAVQALETAAANPQILEKVLDGLDTHDRLILDSFFQMLDPQMAGLEANTLSRWASGSHVYADEVGRTVYKAFGLPEPKGGVELVLRDVATPRGRAQGPFVRGQGFRGFTPADSEATRMGRVAGVEVYSLPDHVLISGQSLAVGVPQTMVDGVLRQGVTREQGIEEWARVIVDDFQSLIMTDADGDVLHEVLAPMMGGRDLLHHADAVPGTDFPKTVVVPMMTVSADPVTRWKSLVQVGFDKMIGPAISSLARDPLWIRNYAEGMRIGESITAPLRAGIPSIKAANAVADNAGIDAVELRDVWRNIPDRSTRTEPSLLAAFVADEMGVNLTPVEAKVLRDGLAADDHVERLVSATAIERALNQSIPYIDDHQVRSFFAEYAKGITPFLYAQEQFFKRWMRTVRHSPAALHRMQLYVGALRSVGFVHTDPADGEDKFAVPLTGPTYWLLSNTPILNKLLGTKGSFPTPMHLTGSVKNVLPGVGDPLGMSPGPVFQFGANLARSIFPELAEEAYDDIYGTKPQRGLIEQWMPAWAVTLYESQVQSLGDAELSRTAFQAMQVLAAESNRKREEADIAEEAGKTEEAARLRALADELLPPDDDINDEAAFRRRERWKHRVAATARAFMVTRAVMQFSSPTAGRPTQNLAFSDEFYGYLATSESFEEATGRLLAENPYALPFTVSDSKSLSGARANYTDAANKWLEENAELAEEYVMAAPWFMPPGKPGDDSYSPRAFYRQVANDWRNNKTPDEWLDDMYSAAAGPRYKKMKDTTEAALAALPVGDPRRVEIRTMWATWKSTYAEQNPTFWRQLTSNDGRIRRDKARREIMQVTEAGKLPAGPYAQRVSDIVSKYNDTVALVASLGAGRTKNVSAKKKALREAYITWADMVITQQPELRSFYDSVIDPDADWTSEED